MNAQESSTEANSSARSMTSPSLPLHPGSQSSLVGHERSLTQIKFNKEGDLLFSCSKDHVINVWYTHNGERLGTYDGHNGTVWTIDVDCELSNPFSCYRLAYNFLCHSLPLLTYVVCFGSTIPFSCQWFRRQHHAPLVCPDGQVPFLLGVPHCGQARRIQRRRRSNCLHHRTANGSPRSCTDIRH